VNQESVEAKPTGVSNALPVAVLRGRRGTAVRVVLVMVTVAAVTLFIAGLPGLYDGFHTLSIYDNAADRADVRANLAELNLSIEFYAAYFVGLVVVLAIGCLILGAILFLRKPEEPMALFVALLLVLLGATFSGSTDELGAFTPIFVWFGDALGNLSVALVFLFFFVFPDGRFIPHWTRWLTVVLVTVALPLILFPGLPYVGDLFSNVLFMSSWVLIGLLAQIYRYRRVSGPAERQQTKWVIFGFAVALTGLLVGISLDDIFSSLEPGSLADFINATVLICLMLMIPTSLGIAILRYRLFDIDVIINRALVYGTLTATVVGIYALVVGGLGMLFQIRGNLAVSLVAAGLVAVLFTPLRIRLQRGVNHLMYGERDEPYKVLSRLGRRLETTLAPEAALETVAEVVAQALKLPYAAIELRRGGGYKKVAEHGDLKDENTVLPLVYQGEEVGRLVVSPRSPGEEFSTQDKRLLEELAWQAGAAAHAALLTTDLRRSRERLITAREEERRRLRRDLHDGLGPTLGGLTLGLDAARSSLSENPSATKVLLADLKAQTQDAVSDVRRLVHGLRPPALDDLGLVSAIRQQAAKHGHLSLDPARRKGRPGKNELTFMVEAPEDLLPLPAAVEVASYRIAQEAITNVSRHAGARSCSISLSVDELRNELVLEVADDGVGMPEGRRAGVGMSSMRERAEELDGTLTIERAGPEGGTRVLARLPLPEEEEQ
jgi:signal transduction histidine kinase